MKKNQPKNFSKNGSYKAIGTRPLRHDGTDKVTGHARYADDVHPTGLLYGKILRSPHAHAIIKSINIKRAMAVPGVKAIVTSSDFPKLSGNAADLEGSLINHRFLSNNCIAEDKVLYKGHALAAVAATSPEVASQAANLIEVDFEILDPVLDPREAMRDNAPILHKKLTSLTSSSHVLSTGGLGEKEATKPTNIANYFDFGIGDVDKGFAEASLIMEEEYQTTQVHQGYIEPHSATAHWQNDNSITVWSSSQGHFMVRELTAKLLGVSESKVRAIPLEIGGGFGGKTIIYLEPIAAALSRKAGNLPVKIVMSRTEVFEATGPAPGSHTKVKMGVTSEGKLIAAEATMIFAAGAYPGSPVSAAGQCIFAPYNIPNVRIQGYDVVVNVPKAVAYRAPGAPQAAFASEQMIDSLSTKLGIDPIDFRLLNAVQEGDRKSTGPKWPKIGCIETLKAAKSHSHYKSPLKTDAALRGRGVASGFWFNVGGPASAHASVNSDGTVSLTEGSPDIGGTRTVAAMHVAEVLGIPTEDVHPNIGDTDAVGYTSLTGGSSVAFKTGWASYEAANDIKNQLKERAAKLWSSSVDEVEYHDGNLIHKSGELRISFKDLAKKLNSLGGPIVGRATVDPKGAGGAFATHIVDVEVDPDTGKVYILRYTAVQDTGKAIHPTYVEGQIQGGAVQGIGWALNEGYSFSEAGHMLNSSFLDYRMATCLDLPMIEAVIVEVPNPGHPYGVRGVGEVPIVPPMAALSNAISNATGVRLTKLPMSPDAVFTALDSHHAEKVSP